MPTLLAHPQVVAAAGTKPKVIEEFVGRVNSRTPEVSIARMHPVRPPNLTNTPSSSAAPSA